MLLLFITLIALGAAAALAAGAAFVRQGAGGQPSYVPGQASTAVRALLAAVLGSVSDRRASALVAALARPAPGVAPQHVLRREPHGPPPGGCHGCTPLVDDRLPPPGRRT